MNQNQPTDATGVTTEVSPDPGCDVSPQRVSAVAARQRRLVRALSDLGLLPLLGASWATFSDDGIDFGRLDDRLGDRLVRALEELSEGIPPVSPALPGPGQLSFGFSDQPVPAAHVVPADIGTAHVGTARVATSQAGAAR